MKNLSKAYYKDYFSDTTFCLSKGIIKANNQKVVARNKLLLASADRKYLKAAQEIYESSLLPVNRYFCLEVRYPGLVTGVGISHEAKVEGEFKLGIHLDYTTGLPVIYGSTVKGVLRSAFQEDDLLEVLPQLVPKGLKEKLTPIIYKMKDGSLKKWADDIFGDDDDRDSRSVYNRDIFFDAIVVDANKNNCFLAADSITPHGSDPLKNPIPLTFVRIASGSKIKFRFKLTNSVLTAEEKETLFRAILVALGIGAKTNVGYGRLDDKENSKTR